MSVKVCYCTYSSTLGGTREVPDEFAYGTWNTLQGIILKSCHPWLYSLFAQNMTENLDKCHDRNLMSMSDLFLVIATFDKRRIPETLIMK
jgi:hypothetical protein